MNENICHPPTSVAFFLNPSVMASESDPHGFSSSWHSEALVEATMEVVAPTDSADAAAPNCARGNILPGMHVTTQSHGKEKSQDN